MANEKRKSYIEKKLELVVNVGNYESLRVSTTFGENIEWLDAEERQKKLDALTRSLGKEVAKDAKETLMAYGLKRVSTAKHEHSMKTEVEGLDEVPEAEANDESEDEEVVL
jgi:heterodisulfide reductase subunit B